MDLDPAQLTILQYPDAVLRQQATPVESIDDTVRAVAARMLELMHEADGVGLAAPQVGLTWRMFVARAADEGQPDRVFVNPQLRDLSGEMSTHEEGCLSLPGITAEIRRPSSATIVARDLDGAEFTQRQEGYIARIWQHEIDHLNGTLIIDRMRPIDRLATRKALKELEAAARKVG